MSKKKNVEEADLTEVGGGFESKLELRLTVRQIAVLCIFKLFGPCSYRKAAVLLSIIFPQLYPVAGRTAAHSTVYTLAVRDLIESVYHSRTLSAPSEQEWLLTEAGEGTLDAVRGISTSLYLR